jgi:hypothetical protein
MEFGMNVGERMQAKVSPTLEMGSSNIGIRNF